MSTKKRRNILTRRVFTLPASPYKIHNNGQLGYSRKFLRLKQIIPYPNRSAKEAARIRTIDLRGFQQNRNYVIWGDHDPISWDNREYKKWELR
jgi:hypothetical protein